MSWVTVVGLDLPGVPGSRFFFFRRRRLPMKFSLPCPNHAGVISR